MSKKELYEATHDVRMHQGQSHYHVEVFGDHLAKKQGYKEHDGIEAVWFYLIQKHHWTPATVRALNAEDLRFLLAEEMSGWTLPKDAIFQTKHPT